MQKIVRFATVEIGIAKSDRQTEIVDDVSDGINANSQDLLDDAEFDDQLSVFPTVKGVGAPAMVTDAPDFDLGSLSDLDYNLSKAFMALRFPKTYADFTTNLSPTAVSLIRGDIRYNKHITKCQTIIENTINDWLKDIPTLKEKGIKFYLTSLPSPESDEVVNSLHTFTDFSVAALSYILDTAKNKQDAEARLKSLTNLFAQETNIKTVEKWASSIQVVINATYAEAGDIPAEGTDTLDTDTLDTDTTDELPPPPTGPIEGAPTE